MMRRLFSSSIIRIGSVAVGFAAVLALCIPALQWMRSLSATWPAAAIAFNWLTIVVLVASINYLRRFGVPALAEMFAPRYALRDTALGLVLGAALCSLVILVLALCGYYHITDVHITTDLVVLALSALPSAIVQEVVFRGIVLQMLENRLGTAAALVLSAAIFGLAHGLNHSASWLSTLNVALGGGLLFGAAFVATRTLWLTTSLHFAWNFFEGPVYGAPISGGVALSSAVSAQVTGPAIITGGAFGPEAGLPALVVTLVAAAVLLIYAKRRGRIRANRSYVRASDGDSIGSPPKE